MDLYAWSYSRCSYYILGFAKICWKVSETQGIEICPFYFIKAILLGLKLEHCDVHLVNWQAFTITLEYILNINAFSVRFLLMC